ncbi:acetylornithine transaminase [Cellulomonas sp. PhB143]|uniref:acetylornithine transaminase n=1 Tax=Cellulomonas sp. PhB143 TaxID=2485186 RepID=UPI000F46C5E2|nr:acetylornithine transaminase [Cellulomonas sp. PhB143]ROS77258.1 acetylornithine aminotransferase [Cellulomonas sp. PhB143]
MSADGNLGEGTTIGTPDAVTAPEKDAGPVRENEGYLDSAPGSGDSVRHWTGRYEGALMDTFGPPQRVLVRGEGAYVWDADGRRYLDLLAGIAVNALGHAHPTLTAAVSAQLGTLGHVSNFFGTPAQIGLAERLLDLAGAPAGSRVFFTNSGTEANEAAFKMARLAGAGLAAGHGGGEATHDAAPTPRVLALEGGFHGRTMGALAMTSKAAYREPFEPLPGGVEFVARDVAALEAAFAAGPDRGPVAALVLEPVQGEAGVRELPAGFLVRARELTREHGALLVLDEVQTGVGRTGSWFAYQDDEVGGGIVPDVVTLAKGLGGGIPVGAVIAYGERAATLFGRGQHGTTFGGNPVAAAAALATLGVIERDGLLENVRRTGAALRDGITGCGNPLVEGVRGRGLLLAVQLTAPVAARVARHALDAGFVVNAVAPDAVRLAPPLILTAEQVRDTVAMFASLPPFEEEES